MFGINKLHTLVVICCKLVHTNGGMSNPMPDFANSTGGSFVSFTTYSSCKDFASSIAPVATPISLPPSPKPTSFCPSSPSITTTLASSSSSLPLTSDFLFERLRFLLALDLDLVNRLALLRSRANEVIGECLIYEQKACQEVTSLT